MVKRNDIIILLEDANFDEIVSRAGDVLFLVDFWAEWCGPCKIFFPIFEEIAIEYHDQVKFGKLNVDGNPIVVRKYNICSIPTLLLFQNGVVISTKLGVLSKKQVQEFLSDNL